jgi:hypothetical protein
MNYLENKLCIFGKVDECEVKGDILFIKITDGFISSMKNTMECMVFIISEVGAIYPYVNKCTTDDNLFILQLKRDSN